MQKISVVIPIYNTEEFLGECLDSVIKQTYTNLEIILIDDGSNKDCREKIESYVMQDDRIRVYHFDDQRGVGYARNFGIDHATGEYVYFLDSDDYIQQNTLELLIQNIGNEPILAGEISVMLKKESEQTISKQVSLIQQETSMVEQFKNMSALHFLISIDFIKRHKVKFSENVACYSDLRFLLELLTIKEEVSVLRGSLYYKRLRNDPITNPSLTQMQGNQVVTDFLKTYVELKDNAKQEHVTNYLDHLFIRFYENIIVVFLEEESNINGIYPFLTSAIQKLNYLFLKKTNILIQSELKALMKNKERRYKRLIRTHHNIRKIRWALQGRTKFYIQMYRSVFSRLPLKDNTIVFESFLGKNYSDSPKYMYEYMINQKMDYKYVWIFNQTGKNIPGNAKQIKRFSLAYYYYLATSKYWVSNSRMPLHLNKREGNVYIQTWHGTPLKKLVFDMNEIHSANPNYKRNFYHQSRRWDYLVSPNQYSSDIFRRAFKYNKEMLEYGYPRNDILYANDREKIAFTIKQKIGIPQDKKVILYAPTWRDDEFYESGKYKFSLKLNLREMKDRLGDEYIIILRMHYFIADNIATDGVEDFAYNLSKYDDIAELYLISDLLITDYSSVFFDYANLKRPILFYTYDLEKYRDTLRGFYIDIEKEVPGPLLKTSSEIIEAVLQLEQVKEEYKDKYNDFYNKFCAWDDGKASENIVNQIFRK